MKLLIALCLVAAAAAAPQSYNPNEQVRILQYENDNIGLGNYKYYYQQSDETAQGATGEIKNEGREDQTLVVKGIFSWIAPNGVRYTVTYTADEKGYQPEVEEQPPGAPGGLSGGAIASALG